MAHQTQLDMLSDLESEVENSPNVIPIELRPQSKSKAKARF